MRNVLSKYEIYYWMESEIDLHEAIICALELRV